MSWSSQKKEGIFVPLILEFVNIYVLSQYKLCWIRFQIIHTFTYQKTLLHTLFSKSSTVFSVPQRGYHQILFTTRRPTLRWWRGGDYLKTYNISRTSKNILEHKCNVSPKTICKHMRLINLPLFFKFHFQFPRQF